MTPELRRQRSRVRELSHSQKMMRTDLFQYEKIIHGLPRVATELGLRFCVLNCKITILRLMNQ